MTLRVLFILINIFFNASTLKKTEVLNKILFCFVKNCEIILKLTNYKKKKMRNVLLCDREKHIEMILMCKSHSVICLSFCDHFFILFIHLTMPEVGWNKQQQQQQQK